MRSTGGGKKEKVEFVAWENDDLMLRGLREVEELRSLEVEVSALRLAQ